ncbi:MAG TPA: hypothetical protein VFD67_04930 [Gemmatimonadaceae bacterium]|nr:hypothetical protein [Gemmatimonadaceae bacterium]
MPDVHRRLTELLVARPIDVVELGEQMYELARRRTAKVRLGGMCCFADDANEYAHRALGADGEGTFGWLAIDEHS